MKTTSIFSSQLPVGEKLIIKKTSFKPIRKSKKLKRISIVSGIHGDELEGQLVIFLLANWLNKNIDKYILKNSDYKIEKIQAMDMFPHTHHIETVVSLIKNN